MLTSTSLKTRLLTNQRNHFRTSSTSTSPSSTLTPTFLTFNRSPKRHSLGNAISELLPKPNYKCGYKMGNDTESSDDCDLDAFTYHTSDNFVDKNQSEDGGDVMIGDQSHHADCLHDEACGGHHVVNPPVCNIFRNVPHYNTQNEDHQRATDAFDENSQDSLT